MSSKIALALLTSVAVAATGISSGASAGHGGGGGGGGGGGHGGGGGGGFHGGGGGGGGGGGFHGGGGGGGFHGGGGGGFHGFAAHPGGGSFHTFAARPGVSGFHGFAPRGFSPGFASHYSGGRTFTRHAFVGHAFAPHSNARLLASHGLNGTHTGLAAHGQFNASRRLSTQGQFAVSHVAAQNFHGLHNFNRAGFNRNAFGNAHSWNHWGGRFWGAGWNHWGRGWGGWAGPVFWPYLCGDIFSFAFWPYDYYDPFWAYGPDFVLVSIFAPGPYSGPDYGYEPDSGRATGGPPAIYYGTNRASSKAIADTVAAAAESCGGLAPGLTDLPIAEIRTTVQPTADQAIALDELNAAVAKANAAVKSSCPTALPLTPVARLDTAAARLDAMIQAVQIVRGPLEKFYDSLSTEQKQRFDAMGSNTGHGSTPPGGDVAALCGQQSGDVAKLPVQRIEEVVQPNAQQQEVFDALKKASENIAEKLQASCPAQMPQTPVARLDAVKTRLAAMVDAMKSIRPKLADFYASLTDEQKARFNTMGPPQDAPSQHQSNDQ